MYNKPNHNNGYSQGGGRQAGGRTSKPKINYFEGQGYIYPHGKDKNAPITFYPFQNGGGAINFSLQTVEPLDYTDQNGQQKIKKDFVPVKVMVNKSIPASVLQNVTPGMLVRVVGRLENETFDQNGTKVSRLVVKAYVFEVLQAAAPYQQPQYGAPAPQYQPQQAPYGQSPQPQYPQTAPAYQQQMPPQYPQQGAPQYQPQAPAYGAPGQMPGQNPPPYYQPAQPQQGPAQGQIPPYPPMGSYGSQHNVKDINI